MGQGIKDALSHIYDVCDLEKGFVFSSRVMLHTTVFLGHVSYKANAFGLPRFTQVRMLTCLMETWQYKL